MGAAITPYFLTQINCKTMKQIILKTKNVYGNEMIYPNCDTSRIFAKLIGKKTFNRFDIDLIRQLDYVVEFSNEVAPETILELLTKHS
jgi:hypothetical protein